MLTKSIFQKKKKKKKKKHLNSLSHHDITHDVLGKCVILKWINSESTGSKLTKIVCNVNHLIKSYIKVKFLAASGCIKLGEILKPQIGENSQETKTRKKKKKEKIEWIESLFASKIKSLFLF